MNETAYEKLAPQESKRQRLEEMRREISEHLTALYDAFDEFAEHGNDLKTALDEELSAPEYDKQPDLYEDLLPVLGEANTGLDKLAEAIEDAQAGLNIVDNELERIRREKIARNN